LEEGKGGSVKETRPRLKNEEKTSKRDPKKNGFLLIEKKKIRGKRRIGKRGEKKDLKSIVFLMGAN